LEGKVGEGFGGMRVGEKIEKFFDSDFVL